MHVMHVMLNVNWFQIGAENEEIDALNCKFNLFRIQEGMMIDLCECEQKNRYEEYLSNVHGLTGSSVA